MNISGVLPPSAHHSSPNQDLSLRPFQRVTAQVLAVTETTALLSIEGHPIVAQLSSTDQAAELLTRQTADFIVTQLNHQKITLTIDRKDEDAKSRAGSGANGPELAVRLLEQHNLPVTVSHLMVARSLLKKNLPVRLDTFEELLGALSAYGSWGMPEADLAAALKAAGLPVSAQSLRLASRQAGKISASTSTLLTILTHLAGQDLPAGLLEPLAASVKMLNAAVLDGESSELAEQLKTLVTLLGTSVERTLLEQSQNSGSSADTMLSLIRLQQLLEHHGQYESARAIAEFLSDLRLNQFLNARPESAQDLDRWLDIHFAVQDGGQNPGREFASARLRIARDVEAGSGKIDPASTRLILQVDVQPGETVEVDLSVIGKQVRAAVTVADPLWCQQAEHELPTLAEALQGAGFSLKDTQFQVGQPQTFDQLRVASGRVPQLTVDIEV